jgi:hypothetical protein
MKTNVGSSDFRILDLEKHGNQNIYKCTQINLMDFTETDASAKDSTLSRVRGKL